MSLPLYGKRSLDTSCPESPSQKMIYLLLLEPVFMNAEMQIPQSIVAAITHDIFINSCQINYSMDQPNDVEVCSLYPELPFRTVDECFNDFSVQMISNPKLVNKPANKKGTTMPNPKPEALFITA
ncbi:leucoanthocyanidin reductase [Populus alba x Populus x berolinensis]|nr:leucoanthocyanidin reductase [Populus alba x Populus x berolinensis]